MPTLCRRRSDGALFRPSYPDGYTEGHAIVDLFTKKGPSWYFRAVRARTVGRWFWRRTVYEDTGDVWEPKMGKEFDVLDLPGRFLA